MHRALLFTSPAFGRFMSAALHQRQSAPLGNCPEQSPTRVFLMKHTFDLQLNPDRRLKSLIDINCNLAAGLAPRLLACG